MSRASTEPGGGRPAGPVREDAVLSRSTLMTVRRMLHGYREGWRLDERLALAARMAAEDAQREGAGASAMLVALKEAWAALDGVQRLPRADARGLLDRLVTLSIRAFYRPSPANRPGASAGGGRTGARSAA